MCHGLIGHHTKLNVSEVEQITANSMKTEGGVPEGFYHHRISFSYISQSRRRRRRRKGEERVLYNFKIVSTSYNSPITFYTLLKNINQWFDVTLEHVKMLKNWTCFKGDIDFDDDSK